MAELTIMGSHQGQEFSKTQRGFVHFYRQQEKTATIANVKKTTMGKKTKSHALGTTDL